MKKVIIVLLLIFSSASAMASTTWKNLLLVPQSSNLIDLSKLADYIESSNSTEERLQRTLTVTSIIYGNTNFQISNQTYTKPNAPDFMSGDYLSDIDMSILNTLQIIKETHPSQINNIQNILYSSEHTTGLINRRTQLLTYLYNTNPNKFTTMLNGAELSEQQKNLTMLFTKKSTVSEFIELIKQERAENNITIQNNKTTSLSFSERGELLLYKLQEHSNDLPYSYELEKELSKWSRLLVQNDYAGMSNDYIYPVRETLLQKKISLLLRSEINDAFSNPLHMDAIRFNMKDGEKKLMLQILEASSLSLEDKALKRYLISKEIQNSKVALKEIIKVMERQIKEPQKVFSTSLEEIIEVLKLYTNQRNKYSVKLKKAIQGWLHFLPKTKDIQWEDFRRPPARIKSDYTQNLQEVQVKLEKSKSSRLRKTINNFIGSCKSVL